MRDRGRRVPPSSPLSAVISSLPGIQRNLVLTVKVYNAKYVKTLQRRGRSWSLVPARGTNQCQIAYLALARVLARLAKPPRLRDIARYWVNGRPRRLPCKYQNLQSSP
jgi:hypothetical protein